MLRRPLLLRPLVLPRLRRFSVGTRWKENNEAGLTYLKLGHADKAIASFQMAISEAKGHSSAAQQQRALTFSNLGAAFRKTGQLADAKSVLSESLGLMLAQSGVDKAILANAHREKALVHEALKEPEAAFKEFEAALQLYSSADSAASFSKELSQCAYSMAMIAHRGKELSKAQPLYAAALKHARAGFTDKHANVAEIQSSLGSLHMDRQDYTAAREAYHDSMLIFKELRNPRLVQALQDYLGALKLDPNAPKGSKELAQVAESELLGARSAAQQAMSSRGAAAAAGAGGQQPPAAESFARKRTRTRPRGNRKNSERDKARAAAQSLSGEAGRRTGLDLKQLTEVAKEIGGSKIDPAALQAWIQANSKSKS